jgi:hypothetical protein
VEATAARVTQSAESVPGSAHLLVCNTKVNYISSRNSVIRRRRIPIPWYLLLKESIGALPDAQNGVVHMTECWVCANPAKDHAPGFSSQTAVGVCTRCSIFACNGHAEFDTGAGLLYCAPCVGGGDSSPPTGPLPDDQPPGDQPPGDRPPGPGGLGLVFSSVAEAVRRFPGFHRHSEVHADTFKANNNMVNMVKDLASKWEETRGEKINLGAVDTDLIARGIGVTLWSAGLNPGELPDLSPQNLIWLVKNPLLAMYVGELVY